MGLRFPSHQLSNGLFVSGRPEQPKEKQQSMSSASMPYTGGDVKKSGELGKMFDVENSKLKKSGPVSNVGPARMGSFAGASPHSGPLSNVAPRIGGFSVSGPISQATVGPVVGLNRQKSNPGSFNRQGDLARKTSGPLPGGLGSMVHQNSGPLPPIALPTTGLITSLPLSSGPLNSSGAPQKVSGPLGSPSTAKVSAALTYVHNQAVTKLSHEDDYSVRTHFPKPMVWSLILLFVMGFIAGGFILGVVHNAVLLIVVIVLFTAVAALFTWNTCWGMKAITGFLSSYPEADLRSARDGQYVKITGNGFAEGKNCHLLEVTQSMVFNVKVVTCGNVPLESSFQKVPRCIYASTSLYEYRGWDIKATTAKYRHLTWGLRYLERHVADFYISDSRSGLRALVKTGYGARVAPYVNESVVVDDPHKNSKLSTGFVRWLGARKISCDDCILRMKEGYIREGSTVSVMGMVQRNENILMIVPPLEPFSTGCQWGKCFLPASLDGIILRCEETSNADVMPV